MKTFKYTFSFVLLWSLLACNDGASSNTPQTQGDGNLSVVIDGVPFSATTTIGMTTVSKTISVIGSQENGDSVYLHFPVTAQEGSTLSVNDGLVAGYDTNGGDSGILASFGSVTIISHDTKNQIVKGNFSFEGEPFDTVGPLVKLTEGKFETSYKLTSK